MVRVDDIAQLLIIALRQSVAAKRDNTPILETLSQGLFILHEHRPVVRLEEARVPGNTKAAVALSERALFLLQPQLHHIEPLQLSRARVPLVEVKDAKGEMQRWAIEWGGASQLGQQGVTSETLKYGDIVTISGNPGRVAEDHRIRMLSLRRKSDNYGWGQRPGETFN